MSYAIIETGGKQLRVEPGRFYDIELLPVEPNATVSIDKVLLIANNGDIHIGQPLVEGATVEGTVLRHFRGRKVIVYKMRPKKKTRKKRGHRQEITRLMINSISVNGSVVISQQADNTTTQRSDAEIITPESAQATDEMATNQPPDLITPESAQAGVAVDPE